MRLFLAVVVALATCGAVSAQQQQQVDQPAAEKSLTYAKAYEMAQAGDKPLLVMVTADWCPPCQVMKANTLPVLMQKKTFKNCHFATVNYDLEPEVADQLIGDRGLPQLIMYERSEGKWLRRYINGKNGIHSVERVESFVAQAGTFRLASHSETENNEKK